MDHGTAVAGKEGVERGTDGGHADPLLEFLAQTLGGRKRSLHTDSREHVKERSARGGKGKSRHQCWQAMLSPRLPLGIRTEKGSHENLEKV